MQPVATFVLEGGADIVALLLTHVEDVQFYPLDLELRNADVVVGPGDPVTIVGFPFGSGAGDGLPVWKTGTVASDMFVNFQGRPMFLVDTTSRPGMSGSPVYAVRSGAYRSAEGGLKMAITGNMVRFLGIYSEQNISAEVGGVWKADVVKALYDSLP